MRGHLEDGQVVVEVISFELVVPKYKSRKDKGPRKKIIGSAQNKDTNRRGGRGEGKVNTRSAWVQVCGDGSVGRMPYTAQGRLIYLLRDTQESVRSAGPYAPAVGLTSALDPRLSTWQGLSAGLLVR